MKPFRHAAIPILLIALVVMSVAGQEKSKNPLVGNWVCEDEGTKVEIRANGTLTINETEYAYKIKNSVINVVGEEGAMAIPFKLEGDKLTVDVEGREMVYTRVKANAKSGGQGSQGFWCQRCTESRSYAKSRRQVVLYVEPHGQQFLHV